MVSSKLLHNDLEGTPLTCGGDWSHHLLRGALLLVYLVHGGACHGYGGQRAEDDEDLHDVKLTAALSLSVPPTQRVALG